MITVFMLQNNSTACGPNLAKATRTCATPSKNHETKFLSQRNKRIILRHHHHGAEQSEHKQAARRRIIVFGASRSPAQRQPHRRKVLHRPAAVAPLQLILLPFHLHT